MPKIEHVGIAVNQLEEAIAVYEKVLGTHAYKIEKQEREKVRVAFFQTGDSKVELLEGLDPESAISKFIGKRGPGLHHIAFAVDDIDAEIQRLEKEGFELIKGYPKEGADNKRVAFLHPASVGGTLIELCQDK